jgi:hypothetical protein
MKNDFLATTRQFNKGLITATNSLLNDHIQDWWQKSQNIEHFQIEMQSMMLNFKDQIRFAPSSFHIIEFSVKKIKFSPDSLTTTQVNLSEENYHILRYLEGKAICEEALDKYRYLFFMFLQVFLNNAERGSNIGAYLAKVQTQNPILFTLLRDHIEKGELLDEAISLRTLQKQCERYLKKHKYLTKRSQLIKKISRWK